MDAAKTGSYLAALRKTRGLTQQEAAERLGVSNKTVSKWESGGGFPEITVLPALAELYGVTADDLLAGETLTDRRREALEGPVTEQRRRLLSRLRLRFDICFVLALALAVLAWLGIAYVCGVALVLSPTVLAVGYLITASPLRDGGLEEEERGKLYCSLYRRLLAALSLEWLACVHLTASFRVGDWFLISYGNARWKAVLFLLGFPPLWLALQMLLRRRAGREARLIPMPVKLLPWVLWALLFFMLWRTFGIFYEQAVQPWLEAYGLDSTAELWGERFAQWPLLSQRRDEELLPWLWARRAVLASGVLPAVAIAVLQWKRRRKKQEK